MFVLHLDLTAKPGSEKNLEKTYLEIFRPAISGQEGFIRVELLRPEEAGDYRLVIVFDHQPSQRKWVATDLHQQVWPQMEGQCAGFSLKFYASV